MTADSTDAVLHAVAAMTAWTDAVGEQHDARALDLVLGDLDGHGRSELIRGLVSLAGTLLLLAEVANGWAPLRTLQLVAFAVAQEHRSTVTPELPEVP